VLDTKIVYLEYTEERKDIIYIVYNDGTHEDVRTHVSGTFINQIEAIFSDFTN